MAKFATKDVRNVVLLGHGGNGKTSIAEAALYYTKAIDRLGKTPEGNTTSDYDAEEIKRGFSISATLEPVVWKNTKINFIDTPGTLDFEGEVLQALRVGDIALIAVDAKSSVQPGTQLAWFNATDAGIPKAFFVNKTDDKEANFKNVFEDLKNTFGMSVCPVVIPTEAHDGTFINLVTQKEIIFNDKGEPKETDLSADLGAYETEFHDMLLESIAETSEELMEKFFGGEEITAEEAANALKDGILSGSLTPVFSGSALKLWGITSLLDSAVDSFPTPACRKTNKTVDGEEPISETGSASVFVFKTISDPFVGKMSFFRVMNGELKNDMSLKNMRSGSTEKFAHFYTICGKKQTEVDSLCCGDLGVIPKLTDTVTNDTLGQTDVKAFAPTVYPEAVYTMAISPKAKGDEDKISTGINRLLEEDMTLNYENNSETKQMLLSGLGDMHLDVVVSKLKNRYNTGVELTKPKIAYRETIRKKVQVEGKHKKQSGGSGQYGHVKITFGPGEDEGLTFTQSVVGGTVPKNFYPAVEKGLLEAMQKGVLAGYPVVNLAADLFDGSYHPVDSNEISFKLAAILAYKAGLVQANPVLLEPVGLLKARIPTDMIGDMYGDINKRRGRILGTNADETRKGYSIVEAEVPKSEMADYAIALRAMTTGLGKYTFHFVRYEEVPAQNAQKVIAESKKDEE